MIRHVADSGQKYTKEASIPNTDSYRGGTYKATSGKNK